MFSAATSVVLIQTTGQQCPWSCTPSWPISSTRARIISQEMEVERTPSCRYFKPSRRKMTASIASSDDIV